MKTKKQETKKETKTKINEEKIKEVGTLLLTAAEITILRKEKDILMKECGELAGKLAVAERENGQLEEKLKAQIASTSNILEAQARLNKRMNIAWFLMTLVFFVMGLWLGRF